MKVGMCVGVLIVDGSADLIIADTQVNILEKEFFCRYCVCELNCRMEVRDEVDIIFQLHTPTACGPDNIVNVPFGVLVQNRCFGARFVSR